MFTWAAGVQLWLATHWSWSDFWDAAQAIGGVLAVAAALITANRSEKRAERAEQRAQEDREEEEDRLGEAVLGLASTPRQRAGEARRAARRQADWDAEGGDQLEPRLPRPDTKPELHALCDAATDGRAALERLLTGRSGRPDTLLAANILIGAFDRTMAVMIRLPPESVEADCIEIADACERASRLIRTEDYRARRARREMLAVLRKADQEAAAAKYSARHGLS